MSKLGYCLVGLGSLVWGKRDTPIEIVIVISPVLKYEWRDDHNQSICGSMHIMLHAECYTLVAVPMPRSDQLNFDPVKSK